MTNTRVNVVKRDDRCPFCHAALVGETYSCLSCHTTHHLTCWQDNGGCSLLGCASNPSKRSAIEEKVESVEKTFVSRAVTFVARVVFTLYMLIAPCSFLLMHYFDYRWRMDHDQFSAELSGRFCIVFVIWMLSLVPVALVGYYIDRVEKR